MKTNNAGHRDAIAVKSALVFVKNQISIGAGRPCSLDKTLLMSKDGVRCHVAATFSTNQIALSPFVSRIPYPE